MNVFTKTMLLVGICAIVLPVLVHAGGSPESIGSALDNFSGETGIEEQSLTAAAGNGIRVVYQVTGLIFFILALYAGIRWMTAQGKEDTVEKARNTLVAATIGLVIVVGAYGITEFITSRATGQFASSGSPIQGGAVGPDGEIIQPVQGCCIFKTSNRNNLAWYWGVHTSSECELKSAQWNIEPAKDGHPDNYRFWKGLTNQTAAQLEAQCSEEYECHRKVYPPNLNTTRKQEVLACIAGIDL